MAKEFINPTTLPNWERSFTQIVTVSHGTVKTVYVSGQVAVDENQNLVGENDLGIQAMRAFQNLGMALAAVGAKATDVVKLNLRQELQASGYRPYWRSVETVFSAQEPTDEHVAGSPIISEGKFLDRD